MINIDKLFVTFGEDTPLETKAIKGVSLNIKEGEFITVIGSNGSGKSTLLNALSGDVTPQKGSIYIDVENITRQSVSERASMVARVFQDPLAGSCANLSIEENMALALNRGKKTNFSMALNSHKRRLFQKQLSRLDLGLENRLGDKMGLLSGGQRQAVSLLMTSLQPAKLLLLDEHTAALDPKTAAYVTQLTCDIVSQNTLTALMVTHSMQQALDVGTRTLMLHNGEIILDVAGKDRQGLTIQNLLDLFKERQAGQLLTDDSLLLN